MTYCVQRDMLQKRKHKLKLAESGAMSRVVREILGLKNAYTVAELAKPFVMARIVFRPDYNDKDVKEKMLQAHIQAMTGIYGPAIANNAQKETTPIDITPISDDPELSDNASDAPPETVADEELTPEEKQILDFENADNLSQNAALTNLAFQVKYNLGDYMTRAKAKDLNEFPKERRLNLFKHLLSLQRPAQTQELVDDVPF